MLMTQIPPTTPRMPTPRMPTPQMPTPRMPTPQMPTPQMPTLPASVVKFIISFLPPSTPPEILLNLFKAFIYDEDSPAAANEEAANENSPAAANEEAANENSPAAAYYKNIQCYITDLAYPKLKSPYFILPPIELPLTDREIMYMVDIQLTHTWLNPFHDDYLPETIQEFCECNHLMKSQPEFDWTNLSIYNIKYIYALEEALLTRSKGMLYWLEKNFCTFVAMSAIYIYFKTGVSPPHDEKDALFDDDFFLDFLIRVNTKGHSGRKPEVLLRLAAKGASLSSWGGETPGAALSNPMSLGGETPGAALSNPKGDALSNPYSPSSSCGGETPGETPAPLIKSNLKLYNKLLAAIKLNKK